MSRNAVFEKPAAPARSQLSLLQEQARLLAGLETILLRDEQRYAAGSTEPDIEDDRARMAILERIARTRDELDGRDISRPLGPDRGKPARGTGPEPRSVRPEAHEQVAAEAAALESANRAKARDLDRRTATLIAGWWIRRNEALAALAELRDGRRLIEASRAGRSVRRDLDVRG